jgi:HEAT repeat protein
VLAGLAGERDAAVRVALLGAVRALVETVRAEAADTAIERVSKCLEDEDPGVRSAAVSALGALRDRRAVEGLTALFDRLGGDLPDLRIAILDALEAIGNGLASWVGGRIRAGDPEERVMVRLVQLLRGYPEDRSAIPALAELLKGGRGSERIRREAASTLGIVGVPSGVPEAIDALCVFGLVDEDQSVRVIAATQLGRAKGEVPGKVVEMLRQRLTDVEPSPRVRLAAARSLLRLRGEAAIPEIAARFRDEEFWQDAVRNFLKTDLIGTGDAVRAAGFVRAICREGMCERCIEAARMVLDAQELKWPAETVSLRIQVAMDLAHCLAEVGRHEEVLKVLRDEVPEVLPAEADLEARAVLLARASRGTGDAGAGLAALAGLKSGGSPAVLLERAWCLVALSRFDEAEEVVVTLLPTEEWGKAAQEVLDAVAEGRRGGAAVTPAPGEAERLVAGLDDPDEAARSVAVRRLGDLGKEAHPALLRWFETRSPEQLPAAVGILARITGLPLTYDPGAPEGARKAALDVVRRALE